MPPRARYGNLSRTAAIRPTCSSPLRRVRLLPPRRIVRQRPLPGSGDSFRERLATRGARAASDAAPRREKGPDRAARGSAGPSVDLAALLARPDGAWVVTGAPAMIPSGAAHRPTAGPTTTDAAARTRAALSEPEVALRQVRVGGAPGAARLHATLAEGKHAGVELRAVEHNGKIAIELVAHSPVAEHALRAEIAELREVLCAKGLDGVQVDVRSGDEERREQARATAEEALARGAGRGRGGARGPGAVGGDGDGDGDRDASDDELVL
jgi:hypothetical protein